MSPKPSIRDVAAWISSTDRLVQRSGAVSSAVIRRRFDFGVERIWTAFSDREQLGKWFGRVSGELREGATVMIDIGAPHPITSRILCCEPPDHLIVTWRYGGFPADHIDEVELRLSMDGGQTLLVLEHRSRAADDWWFGAGSGWEFALVKLGVMLRDGDPAALPVEELDEKLGALWKSAGNATKSDNTNHLPAKH
jgi:uncharacterized protein YndB with AHSA1/START domain